MKHLPLCGLFCLVGLVGCDKDITDRDIKRIGVAEVRALVADASKKPDQNVLLLVDPRSPAEFAQARLPGAVNIQLSSVPPSKAADPLFLRYANVIVYGRDPGSAVGKGMTKRLLAVDVDDVRFFAGGLEEWVRTGGAIEKGAAAPPAGMKAGTAAGNRPSR